MTSEVNITINTYMPQNLSISIDRWLVPPPPENNGSLYERLANHVPHVLSGEGSIKVTCNY